MADAAGVTDRLAELTLSLVDIPSVSRSEDEIAQVVRRLLPDGLEFWVDDGPSMFLGTPRRDDRPFVVLAGHLDTVPVQDNLPGHVEDGLVVGLGSSDMKGGLAVMLELARAVAISTPQSVDVGFLFFGREELPPDESPLPALLAASPELVSADLAVMLEPTDNTIQAGCLGNINATLTFHGDSAHSARPWLGVNAIGVALPALDRLLGLPRNEVTIEGLSFYEVLSVTQIKAGIADNIIPGEVWCRLNYRYAPNRTEPEAVSRLEELVGPGGALSVTSVSGPAHVVVSTPLVERLRASAALAVEPKQAWTPVAQFSDAGIDAINLGPGNPHFAHRRDEQIEIQALRRTYDALRSFLYEGG